MRISLSRPGFLAVWLCEAVCLPALLAQSAKKPSPPITGLSQTLVVLGSATPVPLAESPRPVTVLPVASQSLAPITPFDFLRSDSSVFLEQRGAGGGQSDIVLQGGSFEQTLVLLNGFRINDSQTSHHNLDLPVPLDAIDSIQVLEGAGSTLHGVDALSGVVDFITRAPDRNLLRLRAGAGSFDENEQSLLADSTRGSWSGRLAAGRNFSTGFMTDRDYRNEEASAESWMGTRLGITDLLLASSDRAFGANAFYGNYPSWERTKAWFASARQELGSRTVAAFGYRRHTDDFVLLRDNPSAYENNHMDSSWQASLRHTVNVHPAARSGDILMGLEADGDSIRSFNLSGGVTSFALGIHARNRGAGYLDMDWRPAKRRWTLSAGAREEIFSGGAQAVFSPQVAGSLRITDNLKLRAAAGYGFRIPTYTDLYYSDPTTVGNPDLKPESAWSGNAGADWALSSRLSLSATGFYSRQHDTIDYLRANSSDLWHAANLSGLHFLGAESSLTWAVSESQTVSVAWTGLHGAQSALHGLQSEYIFNYPVENVHAEWTAALGRVMTIRNMVQLAQRHQQTVYPVWNVWLTHPSGRIQPYLRLTNLSNTGYQEIAGVPMPPREIAGGLAIQFGR
ncbi:MAG: TonB-dependent receptor plug domain-containing protein [Terracidiphilus sp.]